MKTVTTQVDSEKDGGRVRHRDLTMLEGTVSKVRCLKGLCQKSIVLRGKVTLIARDRRCGPSCEFFTNSRDSFPVWRMGLHEAIRLFGMSMRVASVSMACFAFTASTRRARTIQSIFPERQGSTRIYSSIRQEPKCNYVCFTFENSGFTTASESREESSGFF